jgi:quercetin dioxygenase-like cupin family protein
VEFLLQGRRIEMREGEAWYLDLNLPHAVANRGRTDRIHLVVDCVVNDWVRALLEQGEAAGS